MAFCSKCGASVADGVKFCPACGQAMGGAPGQPAQQAYSQQPFQQQPYQQGFAQPGVPLTPEQAFQKDVQDNKVMAILSYLGILCLIPLLVGTHKTSPFVKYHLNQGIVLFLATIALSVVLTMVSGILGAIAVSGAYFLAVLIPVFWILELIPVILIILGIVNVFNAKMSPLPVIGGITVVK